MKMPKPAKYRKQEELRKKQRSELRDSMKYRSILNIDTAGPREGTEYDKLWAALVEEGWNWIETSAFVHNGSFTEVLSSLELIKIQCAEACLLSSLTLHIQGSPDWDRNCPAAQRHPGAARQIRAKG